MRTEDMGRKRVFLSHSSADGDYVRRVADRLGRDGVWVDMFDLDAGEMLPAALAEAIDAARDFVVIASRASMESRWVRFEVNQALTDAIQTDGCRIVIVRIDDCDLLPELRAFLYLDVSKNREGGIDRLVRTLASEEPGGAIDARRRRRLIDRFDELKAIESLIFRKVSFIYLHGLYGIGKTLLTETVASETLRLPLARIALTEGHGPLRIALDLASKARRSLPPADADRAVLIDTAVGSLTDLVRSGHVVFFDDLDTILEDDGTLPQHMEELFTELIKTGPLNVPVFLATGRYPVLPRLDILQGASHTMRVGPLKDADILKCLQMWISLTQPGDDALSEGRLMDAARQLHGYPLGARLGAQYVVRYSLEGLLDDLGYFDHLRVDIAKQLLGRMRKELSLDEQRCLQALAVAESGLTMSEVAFGLGMNAGVVRSSVDVLTSHALITPTRDGFLQVLPIVRDVFWHQLYESGDWSNVVSRLADGARQRLGQFQSGDQLFVHYCAKAYNLLALSGDLAAAQGLIYDLRDELRGVGRRLYHVRRWEQALTYLRLWLDANEWDRDTRWYVARCLTRLERFAEAEAELGHLQGEGYRQYRLEHAWGLLRRQQGQLGAAALHFVDGLRDRGDYVPLLRDAGDAFDRLGDVQRAVGYLRQAYQLSPTDSFVVPKYVDILEKTGDVSTALRVLEQALAASPDNGALQHRLSIVLANAGLHTEALPSARRAVELAGATMPETLLHLASLELRSGNLDAVDSLLGQLPEQLAGKSALVRDTVMAERHLRKGQVGLARERLQQWDPLTDKYTVDLHLRFEMADVSEDVAAGRYVLAADRLDSAGELLKAASDRFKGDDWGEWERKLGRARAELRM